MAMAGLGGGTVTVTAAVSVALKIVVMAGSVAVTTAVLMKSALAMAVQVSVDVAPMSNGPTAPPQPGTNGSETTTVFSVIGPILGIRRFLDGNGSEVWAT